MKATMEEVEVKSVLGVFNLKDHSTKKEYRKVQVFLGRDDNKYAWIENAWYSMDLFEVAL